MSYAFDTRYTYGEWIRSGKFLVRVAYGCANRDASGFSTVFFFTNNNPTLHYIKWMGFLSSLVGDALENSSFDETISINFDANTLVLSICGWYVRVSVLSSVCIHSSCIVE